MRRRGFTVLELLIVAALGALLMIGSMLAFGQQLKANQRIQDARDRDQVRIDFEERIGNLLRAAFISSDNNDRFTYFLGTNGDPPVIPTTPASGSTITGNPTGSATADTLTFTTVGTRLKAAVVNSTDDFETQNGSFGPQGGATEVELTTTPYNGSSDKTGLFLRTQTPSDGDPTQGGFQELLSDQISTISYQFFDGSTWQPTWDTTQAGNRKLPSAVMVTVRYQGDSSDTNFIVRLPLSTIVPTGNTSTGATN